MPVHCLVNFFLYRYLWPEVDIFGVRNATWEEDTMLLKECCLVDMARRLCLDIMYLQYAEYGSLLAYRYVSDRSSGVLPVTK